MRKILHFTLLVGSVFISSPVMAASNTPFSKPCDTYERVEDFIANSSSYCLSREHQRNCERAAARYFVMCGYGTEKEFKARQSRAYDNILVRLVLNQVPSIMAVEQRMR